MHILTVWQLELANERRAIVVRCMMIIGLLALLVMGTGCGLEDVATAPPPSSVAASGGGTACDETPDTPSVDPRTVSSFTESTDGTTYVVPLMFDLVGACEYDGELTYATFLFERTTDDGQAELTDICSVFQCGAPPAGIWLYAIFAPGWGARHALPFDGPGIQGPALSGTPHYGTPGGNAVHDRINLSARTPLKLALIGTLRPDAPAGNYRFVITELENGTVRDPEPIGNVPLAGPTFSVN